MDSAADKSSWLGSSLKVPSVQELVKNKPGSVPARYIIRSDQDPPISPFQFPSSSQEIPVIDFLRLLSGNNSELLKLDSACREWGFFQLINHGVRSSLVEKVKVDIQEFFKLPKEAKQKFAQKPGDIEGLGQAFVLSEEQKLEWADMVYLITQPTHFRKPHLFPMFPLPLREDLEEYSDEVRKIAMEILKQMGKALGMKLEEMNIVFENGRQGLRMNYYPPCPQPELVIGLSPHSDACGLTILLQVNEIEGLQIKKDGSWISVLPLPNAFIVNVGDSLEIVTNGIYRSVEHRAVITNTEKERVSIAAFHSAKPDGEIGPAPSLITPENPPKFKTMSVLDFSRGSLARRLSGKSYIHTLKI